MESSSRGRRSGIREEPIAEGGLVRVRVREVRIANWLLMDMEELGARRWLCLTSLEAMFETR